LNIKSWHDIKVVHIGQHIRCYLDDALLLDVQDQALADAGRVGLWSKADAVTYFDDLELKEAKQP
jgi:hypothetical protein